MQLSQSILLAIFLASASSAIAAPAGPSDTTALAERSVDTEEIVELAARSPSPRRGGGRSGSRGRGAFRAAGKALKWAANNAGGNEERSLEEDEVMELAARSPSPEPRRGGGGRSGSRSGSRGRGAFRAAGKAFRFAAQQAGGGNEERSLEEDEVMELAARSPSPEPRGRGGFGGRGGGRGRSGSRRGGFRKFRQAAQQQSNEERSLEEDDVMELAARDFDDEEVMELAARSPSPEPRRGGGGRSGSRGRGRGAFRAAGKAFRFAAQQAGGGNEERSLEEDEVMELAARDFDDEEVMDLAARSPSPRGRGGFGGRGGGRGRSGSRGRGGFRKFRQAAQQQQSNEERSLEEDDVMELAARDFDDEEVMDLAARSPSPEPEPRGRGGFGGRGGGRGRSGSRRGGFRKFRQAAQQQQSNEERSIDELD